MSAETLFLISKISYITAALSLVISVVLWYAAGISRLPGELKNKGPSPQNTENRRTRKTGAGGRIKMLDDIVITHCVSTLDD